jgi:hypothetical protein
LVVTACGSLGAAQPHTLSLGFKAGDTYKYRFHSVSKQTTTEGGTSMPITVEETGKETVTVRSVDSTGVADLAIKLGDFALKSAAGGHTNTMTGSGAETVDVKVRADGTVVSVTGNTVTNGTPFGALVGFGSGFFVAAVLPDHAAKVGDTWTKTNDQAYPPCDGAIRIVSRSKYVRDESVNGVSAAVVETTSAGSIALSDSDPAHAMTGSANGTFTTDVTSWIDPNGRRLLKSHSTTHDALTITLPPTQGPTAEIGDSTTDLTLA